jgi:hypothetical protein
MVKSKIGWINMIGMDQTFRYVLKKPKEVNGELILYTTIQVQSKKKQVF